MTPHHVPFVLLALFFADSAPRAEGPHDDSRLALRAAEALYAGIRTETLANGLRVYLKAIPGSPVVTTMVAYKVGSADEDLENTGLSHYLEHLMFKGTGRLLPGDIDRITFRSGGVNNAYTGEDFTVYHFDLPFDHWEVALDVEADRMRNLRIDLVHEFQQEKDAVISELARNEDTPWDLESKAILPLLFGKSGPYGHPIIGEREHVKRATAEVIKSHYDRWYHPNNAALVVVGAFDVDQALAAIQKRFASIPAAKLPMRRRAIEWKPERLARLEMPSKFATPRLLLGYPAVSKEDTDYVALEELERLLGDGKTSRLYRALVEGDELALSATASNMGGRYPGWFAVQTEVVPGKDRARVEKRVLDEIEILRTQPPTTHELRRAQRGILAATLFGRQSAHGLADAIAQTVSVSDLDYLRSYLARVQAVTPEDIRRVARKYLDPQRQVTVWSVPESPQRKDKQPGKKAEKSQRREARQPSGAFSLAKTKRVELENGLVLLLYEDHRLPLVTVEAGLRDARILESADKAGVAELTGRLLDEGTSRHSGQEIARAIEDVGGVLSMSSDGGAVRVLAPDRALGVRLLLQCLIEPRFPAEAFGRQKESLLAEIAEAQTQPNERAQEAFRQQAFGKHPLGRPAFGTTKTVSNLTEQDLAAFHRRAFVPNNVTLAVVGDFDSQEIIDLITRETREWKRAALVVSPEPEIAKPNKFTQKIITMPQAAQLHFYMGHIGVRRDNPDYFKLLVMDYVLGTGPGFTDRLSSRLRDREGLAYTVSATITTAADREPSLFTCYIGTDNANFTRVKKEFLEELNRIRDNTPTQQEVDDAKTYLRGNLLLQFTTDGGIAAQLLMIERNRLGLDYLANYRSAIASVTPKDVQAVARKYLDPEHMVLVAAGAINSQGKPLSPAPKR
jgi:zinc protease